MESTEEKQNYLRSEILDRDFDTDEFLEYLMSKKGEDATDLDLWTFEELKQVVHEFIKLHTNPNSNNNIIPLITTSYNPVVNNEKKYSNNSDDEKERKSDENLKTTPIPTEEMPLSRSTQIENFDETLKCEKIETTELAKFESIEMRLSYPEKHSGGFFSKAYITYLLTTHPCDFKVRRRYSDFEWLKSVLQIIYPGIMIPPISKKSYGDRFNEVFIEKRMRFLDNFMESLAANPVIKNSQIFYDFLTIEKEEDFVNKKKEYAKLKTPVKLTEMKCLEGEIRSKVNKEIETVCDSVKNYVTLNENLLRKLTTAHKSLFLEMNQVSLRMKEISDIYNQLHFVSEKSNDDVTVTDTYRMLSKLMNDWGEAEKKQSILIDVELKEYFRYIKNEFVAFKENIAKMDMQKSAFYKADSRLLWKKEELYKQGNLTRWELTPEDLKKYDRSELLRSRDFAFGKMLPKDSQHVYSLKQNYGYYSYQLLTEFDRLRLLNGVRHKTHVVRVSSNHSDILADLHVMWADLLSYYSDMYDSNSKQHF